MFASSTRREIRHFHVVVVQWLQRNVQKSVMHVQSCCFANQNLLLFSRSRWRRLRRCRCRRPLLGALRSKDATATRTSKKNNNNNFTTLHVHHTFCAFLCRFCTTTTWKFLISRFMGNVNKQRRNFISLSVLGYGPLEFNFRRVRLHSTK